jgi:DNA-binding transcriptional MerR regulator
VAVASGKRDPHDRRSALRLAGQQGLLCEEDVVALPMDVGYRGPAACTAAGITYRQLDYWARTGLVEPSLRKAEGSGTQRLYSFDDVVRLRVVKRLLDAGVSLQKVRLAVDELRVRGQSLADATLVSDGTSVFTVDDDAQVLDLVRRGQGVFAIALDPVVTELRGEVASFPAEPVDGGAQPTDDEAAAH